MFCEVSESFTLNSLLISVSGKKHMIINIHEGADVLWLKFLCSDVL